MPAEPFLVVLGFSFDQTGLAPISADIQNEGTSPQ